MSLVIDGRRMRVIKVDADGNCCFEAIRTALSHLSNEQVHDVNTMRFIIVSVINRDLHYFRLVRDDLVDLRVLGRGVTSSKLSDRILHEREWGTGAMIHILAQFYEITIKVHGYTNGEWVTQTFPLEYCAEHPIPIRDGNETFKGKTIHLLATHQHFDALVDSFGS